MNTKLISLIGATAIGLFALSSCKEQPVGIDYGNAKKADTTYMATVESPQVKNFYVEEFSGVRCTNCPQGAAKLEALSNANPDRIKIITIHAGALTAPNYAKGSKQDLTSAQGGQLMTLIYGEPNKPAASFDRMAVASGPNPLVGLLNQWDAMLESVKTQNATTPINLHLSSKYNATKGVYEIQVKAAYTQAVSTDQYLSIFLIEDNIVDYQIDPLIPDFNFRHVFRQALTPVNGVQILADKTNKEAGLVYETNYEFAFKASEDNEFKHKNWNLENVHVVALVHNATAGNDKRVLQVVDTHLK